VNIPWKKIGKYALTLGVGYLVERSRKKLPKVLAGILDGLADDTPETPAELKAALDKLLEAKLAAHIPKITAQLEASLSKRPTLAQLSAEAALARERGRK
jgi:hypothetical protein